MVKPLDPSLAQNSASQQNLSEIKRKADLETQNLNGGNLDKNKAKKLREACEGFESIFIQQMWQSMRASVPQEGLMHSREEKFWQGMYDQELSKSMASAGGIGLADMMMSQLSKNLKNASEVAAESLQKSRTPLDIEPVPLIQKPQGTPLPETQPLSPVQQKPEAQPEQSLETEPQTPQAPPTPVESALEELAKQQQVMSTNLIQGQESPEEPQTVAKPIKETENK